MTYTKVEPIKRYCKIAIKALWGRPKGEWIYWREDGIKRCKCSRCLTSYGCLDTPYCPNCGEKMVEGRSEE